DSDPACLEVGLAQGMDGLSAVRHAIDHAWGLEIPPSQHPRISLTPDELEWARQFLDSSREIGLPRAEDRLIAISPGASDDLKRWPAGRFAQLCRSAIEELGAAILLFCGPGEARILGELADRTGNLPEIRIVQNLHLRRVAALLSFCTLYIGNDSGLTHMAAAVQTPVVAFFGPTSPHLYLPRWVPSRAVVTPVTCPYQPHRAFGHPRCVLAHRCLSGDPCIETIELREAWDALKETWEQVRGSQSQAEKGGL
ncbi:MAG: glycosyltransferase family 9 protein, partial [Phycisphaerales bacterium]